MIDILQDPLLERLLADLHARSDAQAAIPRPPDDATLAEDERAARLKAWRSDKLVALDRDKAAFCYQLCRARTARRVVEIGTSYGVSTLWLAAAVRDNLRAAGGEGVVIGTEYEPDKARAARTHFAAAGLERFIELREGDLRETLKSLVGPIDFVLMDIWVSMARPALELVSPHLAPGAIVVADNTASYPEAYADYFVFLRDPANRFRTMTLPFDGGLELTVRCP